MKNEGNYVGGLMCELIHPENGQTYKHNFGNRIPLGKSTDMYDLSKMDAFKQRNGWLVRQSSPAMLSEI
jgi:hypothetical protein